MAAPLPPYGPAIHQARASGDLEEMRKAAAAAEEHLEAHGDVKAAHDELKAEIAKRESGGG
jgi:hypothetical protein